MFLWGHHMGVTLHLRGPLRDRLLPRLEAALPALQAGGFGVCVSAREWEHHVDADNHRPARDLGPEAWQGILRDLPFTKVALALPLSELNDGWDVLMEAYVTLAGLLR